MLRYSTVALLAGLFCLPAQPAVLTVTGVVIQPSCSINDGGSISVNFGDDIMTTRIDGHAYKKKQLSYSVDCEGNMASSALKITIKGTTASFGDGLLQTTKSGLGVQFLADGVAIPLNTGAAKFDYQVSQLPVIEAVLARDTSITLTGGAFSATATLDVDYQ